MKSLLSVRPSRDGQGKRSDWCLIVLEAELLWNDAISKPAGLSGSFERELVLNGEKRSIFKLNLNCFSPYSISVGMHSLHSALNKCIPTVLSSSTCLV